MIEIVLVILIIVPLFIAVYREKLFLQFTGAAFLRTLNHALVYVVVVSAILGGLLIVFNKEIQTENSIDDIYDILGVVGAMYLSFSLFVFIPLVIIMNIIRWARKGRHS